MTTPQQNPRLEAHREHQKKCAKQKELCDDCLEDVDRARDDYDFVNDKYIL